MNKRSFCPAFRPAFCPAFCPAFRPLLTSPDSGEELLPPELLPPELLPAEQRPPEQTRCCDAATLNISLVVYRLVLDKVVERQLAQVVIAVPEIL